MHLSQECKNQKSGNNPHSKLKTPWTEDHTEGRKKKRVHLPTMHLTNILLRGMRKFPRGSIYIGKNRLVRPVLPLGKALKIEEIKIEERNMFLLRHPYLSPEEERGYVKNQNKHEKWVNEKKMIQLKKFERHTKLTDHLCDLRHGERWD